MSRHSSRRPVSKRARPTSRHYFNAGSLGVLGDSFNCPILTQEKERDLVRRWLDKNDAGALTHIVTSHGRLVVKIASKYRKFGLPFDDLVQEGVAGLIGAVNRFDLKKGYRLSTYARWYIRAAIQAFIIRNWSSVRLSKTEENSFFTRHYRSGPDSPFADAANDNRSAFVAKSPGQPYRENDTGIRLRDASLNTPISEGVGNEQQDLIADDRPLPEVSVIDALDRQTWSERLHTALESLPERERIIIQNRHLSEEREGLKELGKRFGVSKERARQLEKQAMERLEELLKRDEAGDDRPFS